MEIQELKQRIRSLGEAVREQEEFYRSTSQFLRQVYQQNSLTNPSASPAKSA